MTDSSAQLALLRNRMAHQILSAGSGRLYNITLTDYSAGKSRLVVLFDSLIVDGLSMLTLFSECSNATKIKRPKSPLAIQFRDYQCWRSQQGQAEDDIIYWQQRFDVLPPCACIADTYGMVPAASITPRFHRLEAQLEPAP
ncbi:MAG: hypothetical protein ACR5LD_08465 [Symbiopectobacterium sp.]